MLAGHPMKLGGPAPSTRVGRYRILAPLASGGMGTVYVGRAEGLGGFSRLVAVKCLHQDLSEDARFVKNFFDEARLAALIDHPNVVSTHDVFHDRQWGYLIVMDYVHGHHAGILIRKCTPESPMPVPVALRIVTDALAGLSAAHSLVDQHGKPQHLIHRDVTPHNILLGVNGNVKLTDFGVARAAVRLSNATQEGEFKGKIAYGAPEYLTGKPIDQRVDIFSMGVVLWEALTGDRLYSADSRLELLGKILNEDVRPPSSYRSELVVLDEIVLRALARDVDKRFQTADDMRDALIEVAKDFGGLASTSSLGKLVRATESDVLKAREERIREGDLNTQNEDATVTVSSKSGAGGDNSRMRLRFDDGSSSGLSNQSRQSASTRLPTAETSANAMALAHMHSLGGPQHISAGSGVSAGSAGGSGGGSGGGALAGGPAATWNEHASQMSQAIHGGPGAQGAPRSMAALWWAVMGCLALSLMIIGWLGYKYASRNDMPVAATPSSTPPQASTPTAEPTPTTQPFAQPHVVPPETTAPAAQNTPAATASNTTPGHPGANTTPASAPQKHRSKSRPTTRKPAVAKSGGPAAQNPAPRAEPVSPSEPKPTPPKREPDLLLENPYRH